MNAKKYTIARRHACTASSRSGVSFDFCTGPRHHAYTVPPHSGVIFCQLCLLLEMKAHRSMMIPRINGSVAFEGSTVSIIPSLTTAAKTITPIPQMPQNIFTIL